MTNFNLIEKKVEICCFGCVAVLASWNYGSRRMRDLNLEHMIWLKYPLYICLSSPSIYTFMFSFLHVTLCAYIHLFTFIL